MREPGVRIQVLCQHDDVACVVYTGGTTGRPKGVMLPDRCAVYNFWLEISGHQWPDQPRFLAVAPISHAAFLMIVPCLALGGSVVLHDRFDPEHFIADIAHQRVTATFIVPSMLYALLDDPAFEAGKLSSLQTVLYGASPVNPARITQALEALGQVFVQIYAQTEAPNTATALRKEDHDPASPHLLASCGKPLVGVEVEVHDPDENECPAGEVGEIVIRGQIVMDGSFFIVDRLKDMIVTGASTSFRARWRTCCPSTRPWRRWP